MGSISGYSYRLNTEKNETFSQLLFLLGVGQPEDLGNI